ncbi:hypothetical protein [Argonema galeatum]|uniref:hypothetical protein n=1 Tax=Argonema galeatum TaxID=2942762 RepID=UPI002011447D|nr:hypothetical protein [Argonema galeatum]MCL1463218.1 hypothetical protein [Argonema galeatum A003/A1]
MKAVTLIITAFIMLIICTFYAQDSEAVLHGFNWGKEIITASNSEINIVELSELPIAQPPVEMEFVEWQFSKPPLKHLVFNITLRNQSHEPRWFLLPKQLTISPQLVDLRIEQANILELHDRGRLIVGNFYGYDGFWALLLPGNAEVKIRRFRFSFWGEDIIESIPIEVVIGSHFAIDGKPAESWLGVNFMSDVRADVIQNENQTTSSRTTPDGKVVPVSIVEERRLKLQVNLFPTKLRHSL